VAADLTGDLPTTSGVSDQDSFREVELFYERRKVVSA
jgi:hypothetical protein